MTVTTLSTVGYGDLVATTRSGRIFSVALIVVGVGMVLYLIFYLAEALLHGSLRDVIQRRAMQRQIENVSEHVIVCGFGRFGRVVAEELRAGGPSEVVVVESDANVAPALEASALLFVLGSATSDEVLERAGIRRAQAIVLATSTDSDNVFIALAARDLHPGIRVYARGGSDESIRRLRQAGATQVVSPYQMGGTRLAASILRPAVVDFMELSTPRRGEAVDLEEVALHAGSPLAGRSIGSLEQEFSRLRVVARRRRGEDTELVPEASSELGEGDLLVVIGDRGHLEDLARLAHGAPARGAGES